MHHIIKVVVRWIASSAIKLLRVPAVGKGIVRVPFLHRRINRFVINRMALVTRTRPHPFSTQSAFTSWSSLTDKTWSARHLPVSAIDQSSLPGWEGENGLRPLFERQDGEQRMCPKSTLLFVTFAQYLTDGFIRTVPEKDPDTGSADEENRKRNTSNHEIDMCPLYGRTVDQTNALRIQNPSPAERGRLRSQEIDGEEFPPFLFENGVVNPVYDVLDTPLGLREIIQNCESDNPAIATYAKFIRDKLFAVGGDRVNSVPQVSLMNTLWLREHNRLAFELASQHESWSDDQVFETARNIVIVEFIKVVVEDYINHIAPIAVPLMADSSIAWEAPWNKANWITTEFSLLYRWHALVPDSIRWGDSDYSMGPGYLMNNMPLITSGLKRAFEDLSSQKAAELGPRNTNERLVEIENNSIRQGRICQLASYNEYRKYLGRKPVSNFSAVSSDPFVVSQLERAYRDVDEIDFFVGIFCEDRIVDSPLPQTIFSFVALDAFTQALTNPLLSEHVFSTGSNSKDSTFSSYGNEQIRSCKSLKDIVVRNIKDADNLGFVGMTQQGWAPSRN